MRALFIGLLLITNSHVVLSGESSEQLFKSWQTLKFEQVVKQGLDYSCGSASMATILEYYFGDPISESSLTLDMTARLSKEELEDRIKEGFSMLDMRDTLVRFGYQAVGVKLSFEQAEKLKGPIIVLLRKEEINHFVVLKGVVNDNDLVQISDPTSGNLKLTKSEFLHYWQGEALAIGKAGFELSDAVSLKANQDSSSPAQESARSWVKTITKFTYPKLSVKTE